VNIPGTHQMALHPNCNFCYGNHTNCYYDYLFCKWEREKEKGERGRNLELLEYCLEVELLVFRTKKAW